VWKKDINSSTPRASSSPLRRALLASCPIIVREKKPVLEPYNEAARAPLIPRGPFLFLFLSPPSLVMASKPHEIYAEQKRRKTLLQDMPDKTGSKTQQGEEKRQKTAKRARFVYPNAPFRSIHSLLRHGTCLHSAPCVAVRYSQDPTPTSAESQTLPHTPKQPADGPRSLESRDGYGNGVASRGGESSGWLTGKELRERRDVGMDGRKGQRGGTAICSDTSTSTKAEESRVRGPLRGTCTHSSSSFC